MNWNQAYRKSIFFEDCLWPICKDSKNGDNRNNNLYFVESTFIFRRILFTILHVITPLPNFVSIPFSLQWRSAPNIYTISYMYKAIFNDWLTKTKCLFSTISVMSLQLPYKCWLNAVILHFQEKFWKLEFAMFKSYRHMWLINIYKCVFIVVYFSAKLCCKTLVWGLKWRVNENLRELQDT